MEHSFSNYCEKLGQAAVSLFEIYLCHLPFNAVTTVPQLLEQEIILGPIYPGGEQKPTAEQLIQRKEKYLSLLRGFTTSMPFIKVGHICRRYNNMYNCKSVTAVLQE